jgi:hypothetical protein
VCEAVAVEVEVEVEVLVEGASQLKRGDFFRNLTGSSALNSQSSINNSKFISPL